MIGRHTCLSILLTLFIWNGYGQHPGRIDSCYGEYVFYNDDSLVNNQLILLKSGEFYYKVVGDLWDKFSYGKWRLRQDTLVVSSKYQRGDKIPLLVSETTTSSEEVDFGFLTTRKGELIPNAVFFINGDTSKAYDFLSHDYHFPKGKVKSFQVWTSNFYSEEYFLKNTNSNKIEVRLDVEGSLSDYLLLREKKYVITGAGLLSISDNKVDSVGVGLENLMQPYVMKKIK